MQLDPPVAPPARTIPTTERNYHPDGRAYGPSDRGYPPPDNRMPYQQDVPLPSAYGQRPPVTAPYEQPRYAPEYPAGNGPPGYSRPGEHIPPVSSPYDSNHGPRLPVTGYAQGNIYAQAPPPSMRPPRDAGYPQQEYVDPSRYAYPSPATTVSSIAREPVATPPQQQQRFDCPVLVSTWQSHDTSADQIITVPITTWRRTITTLTVVDVSSTRAHVCIQRAL
jgi:hypothetical protein